MKLENTIIKCTLCWLCLALPVHAAPGFVYEFLEHQGVQKNADPIFIQNSRNVTRAWNNQIHDFQKSPYPIPLKAKNDSLNLALLEKAKNYIEQGQILIRSSAEKTALLEKSGSIYNDGIWWKQIDQANYLAQSKNKIRQDKAQKLASLSKQGMMALDSIDDLDISQSPTALIYYRTHFRNFISAQILLGNFNEALPILQRLDKINDIQPDWIMHYFLGLCYKYKFLVGQKNTGMGEANLRKLRRLKNEHLLKSVEARYSLYSVEYKRTKKRLQHEELGPPR